MANIGIGRWDTSQSTKQRTVVLRLGAQIRLGTIASLPERYRARLSQLNGRLGMFFLMSATNEGWPRLSSSRGGQIWPPSIIKVEARTFPLNDSQPSTPPPDAIGLQPHMLVECKNGYVGKLEGVVVDANSGLTTALLLRVRSDVGTSLSGYGDPLAVLLPQAGRLLMLSPDWAHSPQQVNHALGASHHLQLEATFAQVASGLVLRDDGELTQDVWDILGKSPSIAPYFGSIKVTVQDGTVTLAGPALSPRLRASVEQDIWHIPGVLNVRNQLG